MLPPWPADTSGDSGSTNRARSTDHLTGACNMHWATSSMTDTPRDATPLVHWVKLDVVRSTGGGALSTPVHTHASAWWIGALPVAAVISAAANVTDRVWSYLGKSRWSGTTTVVTPHVSSAWRTAATLSVVFSASRSGQMAEEACAMTDWPSRAFFLARETTPPGPDSPTIE